MTAVAFHACAHEVADDEFTKMLDELARELSNDSAADGSAPVPKPAPNRQINTSPTLPTRNNVPNRIGLTLVADSGNAVSTRESPAVPDGLPSVSGSQAENGTVEPEPAHAHAPKEEAYYFPNSEPDDLADLDHAALVDRLRGVFLAKDPSGRPASYLQIREEACALNTELNRRQMFAPRFRPIRIPPAVCKEREDIFLSLDRQVIDLHWLKCRGRTRRVGAPDYADMFRTEFFDFDLASRFAMEGWYPESKAETALHLTQRDQWELCSLQSKAHRDAWRKIRQEREDIRTALEESVGAQPHMQRHVDDWVLLWTAKRIVGDGPSELSKCFALATGNPVLDESGIRRKWNAVNARINRHKRGKAS